MTAPPRSPRHHTKVLRGTESLRGSWRDRPTDSHLIRDGLHTGGTVILYPRRPRNPPSPFAGPAHHPRLPHAALEQPAVQSSPHLYLRSLGEPREKPPALGTEAREEGGKEERSRGRREQRKADTGTEQAGGGRVQTAALVRRPVTLPPAATRWQALPAGAQQHPLEGGLRQRPR